MHKAAHEQGLSTGGFPRSRNPLFVCCALLSFAAHAALLALFLNRDPSSAHAAPAPLQTIDVRILLEEVTVQAEQPTPPPPPELLEPELPPKALPETPALPPAVESPPTPVVEVREPEPIHEPAVQEPAPVKQPAVAATIDLQQMQQAYWSLACQHIAQHMRYPRRAQSKGWTGRVLVRLKVDADGTLHGVPLPDAASRPVLTEAVTAAIRAANPLPPPPPELGAPVTADLPIRFAIPGR